MSRSYRKDDFDSRSKDFRAKRREKNKARNEASSDNGGKKFRRGNYADYDEYNRNDMDDETL